MQKILFSIVLSFLALTHGNSQDHSFIHPGINWTLDDLNQMKANRKVRPWSNGWKAILKRKEASLDYKIKGPAINVDRKDNDIANDGDAALFHALQWHFTGKSSHAKLAISILEAWATTHETWSGNSVHLHAAWRGGTLVQAAEILRYTYPGWTAANTKACEDYFQNVLWPQFRLPNPLRAANQGANNLWGAIQVAVFCNDSKKFNQCIDAFLTDACGGLPNSLANGQNGDSGRDQGHAFAMIGNLASVAEIAWSQGIDLYGALDNRLLALNEYWCLYNLGEDVPFIDFGTCYGYYTSIGSKGRRDDAPYTLGLHEKIYGAYVVRKKLKAPFTKDYRDGLPHNEDTFLHRKDSSYKSTASTKVKTHPDFIMGNVVKLSSSDIGSVDIRGKSKFKKDTWTIEGSGSDLYGGRSEDSFHYAYTRLNGDGCFIAKVASIENTDESAKAGIVIRESLDANSKMLVVNARPTLGSEFSSRGFDAADGNGRQSFPLSTGSTWLKIERRGDHIIGFVGPDGVTWTPMQHTIISLPKRAYIGLGVTSHNNNKLCEATFTNVQMSKGVAK